MVLLIAYEMLQNRYPGELMLFCNDDVADKILAISQMTLQGPQYNLIGNRIHLNRVVDGDKRQILQFELTFFDLKSPATRQFGFSVQLPDGQVLVCLGDEDCHTDCEHYVYGADWLLTEGHCLDQDIKYYNPRSLNHSTVRDACELASRLAVRNLVL